MDNQDHNQSYEQDPNNGIDQHNGERHLSKDERTWGMLAHLAALVGLVIPFGSIVGPLVVYLIKKEDYPFVADQGKESLNFQISMFIYFIISAILAIIVIGFILMGILSIFAIIMVIVASIKANDGVSYRYPLTIRFIK
ncbi:DUF4870 domain-containing protein [Caldalkalibacillus salinus]|uniref:DUF4870 domain-containing protein n=1 Tax=Caldalkalibacillus salinus TaxID=2803787 RepID=UPI001F3AD0DD|nr:DUF4870 domain-containing protein [Caldalkalibacillus salinus]